MVLLPVIDVCNRKNPLYQPAGAFTKNNHAEGEQNSVNQTRQKNPFPKLILLNEAMGIEVRLECNDDFLKQAVEI